MKIRPQTAELLHAERHEKLVVAYRNLANAPGNRQNESGSTRMCMYHKKYRRNFIGV